MIVTKFFLITFATAFFGVLPPGLVNMTVAKTCIERGRKSGLLVAIGGTAVVFLQALIGIHLARYFFEDKWMVDALLKAGVVVFLLLGIFFFLKARKRSSHKKVKLSEHGATRSFFKGVMISAFNILPIPYFCAVATALNIKGTVEYDVATISSFVLAAGLGTFLMLYIYVVLFLKLKIDENKFAKRSNYFMAVLMLFLAISTVGKMFYQ